MGNKEKKSVIIVAGGKGKRMSIETPKQYLPLNGKPVLMHTILKFHSCVPEIFIVVVLPFDQIEEWNRIISEHRFIIPHQIVPGGEERFHSVKNGLNKIDDDGLVAIHDGVRPLVSEKVIHESFSIAKKTGAAIPVIRPSESLRQIVDSGSKPVNRDAFRLVQTPQTFQTSLIKKAYQQPYEPWFTDDASVFEADGYQVTLFEGNRENIKITWPEDIYLAGHLIARNL